MRNTPKKKSNKQHLGYTQQVLLKAMAVVAAQDKVLRFYAKGGSDGGQMAKDMFKDMGLPL